MSTAAAASTAAPAQASRAPAHPLDYVPLRGAKGTGPNRVINNMDYNGGPVMPSNTDYMVLWAPPGSSPHPRAGQAASFSALGTVSAQPVIISPGKNPSRVAKSR